MKQIILLCLLMLSGFLDGGGMAFSSECISVSKCDDAGNSDHSGKLCCEDGFPVASCEASTSDTCIEDCLILGGSMGNCSNQCTSTSCEPL